MEPFIVRQSRQPEIVEITPTLTGGPELCLTCHQGEISASHPQESFGCVLCHGGDGLALDADLAHATTPETTGNPRDLAVVEESCGGPLVIVGLLRMVVITFTAS